MIDSIKITSLNDIGSNLAANTIFPVVDVSVPITNKANLQIIGNLILSGAGGSSFVQAAQATLAQAVVNSAQPNITSVGTLSINTLRISGGNNGQYLQTNGSGNLAWVSGGGSGNGVVGGSNAQIQFNSSGNFAGNPGLTWSNNLGLLSTLNLSVSSGATIYGSTALTNLNVAGNLTTNNIFTDHYYYANGAPFGGGGGAGNIIFAGDNISSINDIVNVVGDNYAQLQSSDTFMWVENGNANIEVNGKLWHFDSTGNLTLPTNTSSINYANGSPYGGGGNANTGNVTFDDINIIGTGNLNLQPDPANSGSYLDIFLTSGPDLHLVASASANLILGKDLGANVMASWDGNTYVQAWDGSNASIWTFGNDGNITLPNDANIATIGNVTQFNTCTNGFLSLNSFDAGGNNIASIGINSLDGLVGINTYDTATDSDYHWAFTTFGRTIFPTLTVDLHNGGNQTAQTLQFGDPSQQAVITGPTPAVDNNAQRLIIQGQRGSGTGEGGDVYVWGGDSDVNGGDIKIYAGDAEVSGYGGYINIDGGTGINGGGGLSLTGGQSADGQGGQITITPGYSGNSDGATLSLNGGQAAGNGGGVNITAGAGTANGGQVTIIGGQSALGLSGYGNVVVSAGASQWKFDNTGNLVLPSNTFAVNYANGTQVPLGGGGAAGNAGDIQINVAGNIGADSTLRYVDSGGEMTLYADYLNAPGIFTSDIYAGDGTPSNITLTTNYGNATWTFDTDGNLTVPSAIVGPASANLTIYANAGVHSFTFADDGTFYAPDNVVLGGTTISVGPDANTLNLANSTLVISSTSTAYIQAVINNVSDNGSADWVAQGHLGNDDGGWVDMGFTSSFYSDPDYTITGPGDGYVITQAYLPGQAPAVGNGSLVFATGENGTQKDIIFGTGGFLTANIFGRISDANNELELSRANSNINLSGGGNIINANVISANSFVGNGSQLTGIPTQTTGNWTLAPGVNTVNISVPLNGTYSIWVKGNIPNGIVTYTATAVVTNNNVPVLGSSYGWYYAAGNALVLTSIPTQFVGTVNNISNAVVSTTTANVFTFGITNNSGNAAVVNWGYTKL